MDEFASYKRGTASKTLNVSNRYLILAAKKDQDFQPGTAFGELVKKFWDEQQDENAPCAPS